MFILLCRKCLLCSVTSVFIEPCALISSRFNFYSNQSRVLVPLSRSRVCNLQSRSLIPFTRDCLFYPNTLSLDYYLSVFPSFVNSDFWNSSNLLQSSTFDLRHTRALGLLCGCYQVIDSRPSDSYTCCSRECFRQTHAI
jgi:hypothetical protein